MGAWLFLLGGLLVWAAHFFGVYGIASLAEVVGSADAPWARWTTAGWTGVCLAVDGVLLAAARRRRTGDELEGFLRSAAAGGALISMVGVAWQGLPALIGR